MHRYFIKHLLIESVFQHQLSLLLENYRLEKIEQIVNSRLPEQDRLNKEQIETIVHADPTSHGESAGKYSEWLVKQYIQADTEYRSRFFEDLYKYTEALERYHELKTRNKVSEKDINKIKNLEQLYSIIETKDIESIDQGFPDTRELEANGEVEVLLRDPMAHLYWTKTQRANSILGSNTKWCTVPKGSPYFKQYDADGPIFIAYVKNGNSMQRHQYHFESQQFMDERDMEDKSFLKLANIKSALIEFAIKNKNVSILSYYRQGKAVRQLLDGNIKLQKKAIEADPSVIRYIEHPSDEMMRMAIKSSPQLIRYIPNAPENIQLLAISLSYYLPDGMCIIDYIPHPSFTVLKSSVKKVPKTIYRVNRKDVSDDQYFELVLLAIEQNAPYISLLGDIDEDKMNMLIKINPKTILYMHGVTEKMKLSAIQRDPFLIEKFDKQTEEMKWEALKISTKTFSRIKKPSREMLDYIVEHDVGRIGTHINDFSESEQEKIASVYPAVLQYIDGIPSKGIQWAAYKTYPAIMKNIGSQITWDWDNEIQLYIAEHDVDNFYHIKHPSSEAVRELFLHVPNYQLSELIRLPPDDLIPEVVRRDPKYIKRLIIYNSLKATDDIILTALSVDGRQIENIPQLKDKFILAALKQNGEAIENIAKRRKKNLPEKWIDIAMKTYPGALVYKEHLTETEEKEVMKNNPNAFTKMKHPSKKLQLSMVKKYPRAITFIENPDEDVQIASVTAFPDSFKFISNPTNEVRKLIRAIRDGQDAQQE